MVSEEDRARITRAVAAAERATSGEIVVTIAETVSDYREIPTGWAAGTALIAPALAVWLGAKPANLAQGAGAWIAAHNAALDASIAWAIAGYAAAQAVLFVAVFALVSWRPLRPALTPRRLRRERARKAAMAQFLATGLDASPARTGVLIFLVIADRSIEIIADAAIHAKVGAGAWDEAVRVLEEALGRGALAEGLERAIALCGAALAAHFPPGPDDRNDLPDAPRVI